MAVIDLAAPPAERWQLSLGQRRQARSLLDMYQRELSRAGLEPRAVAGIARHLLGEDSWAELASLGVQMGVSTDAIALGNLYYDALKFAFGCTAFAIDTPTGPLHARNLDWWTDDRMLSHCSLLARFDNGAAGSFTTVGWPGFMGAFSGVAPGRFSISLNAVMSGEPGQLAIPIVLLIRQVLAEESTFEAAVRRLSETPIASDCLLLVCGPDQGQMAVIERTPRRSAIRRPEGPFLFATNDYLALPIGTGPFEGELQATSCGRLHRIAELLTLCPPEDARECLELLKDPQVQMGITVQQMVFDPRTGAVELELP